MIYIPLFELYFMYEKRVNDFFVQLMLNLIAYSIDGLFYYGLGYNLPTMSLLIFVGGLIVIRFVIRLTGKQEIFGGFANYGLWYSSTLGVTMWLMYLFIVRAPKFR